ncbi:MAG: GAF domain-containing protein [Alishewanella sp.]|nr:GAF domain-containing protein [Alishewanella sp.]
MSNDDMFQWWRQAPFGCALYQETATHPEQWVFVDANAIFKVVTGLTAERLAGSQPEEFNRHAVYFSESTALCYQVDSYAPAAGFFLVILQQIPNLHFASPPTASQRNPVALVSLLLELGQHFSTVEPAALPAFIQQALAKLGQTVAADRVYIFNYDFNNNTCSNTFEWCAEGVMPEINSLQGVPLAAIPQWLHAHQTGQEMHIPDVPALPKGDALKQILQPQGIKSLLTIPLLAGMELLGFVGFDSVKQYRYYTEQERLVLGVFARMLVNLEVSARNRILK